MKLNKIIFALAAGLVFAACSDIDEVVPQSGTVLTSQLQEIYANMPQRAEAAFNGMFTDIGKPTKLYNTPDDWEFLMLMFCNDAESADLVTNDNNYNWFSVCGEYSSRASTYRNPAIRYRTPYLMISSVNTFLSGYDEEDPELSADAVAMIAQAKCLRAFSYMMVAPQYQFAPNTYVKSEGAYGRDLPCVPINTGSDEIDFAHNPRATVSEIYDFVMQDLNDAVDKLEGFTRSSKKYIDQQVAYGLRARVNLLLGNWQAAYDDAAKAAEGYTPASIADVSKPAFMNISEGNWIWGYEMSSDLPQNVQSNGLYATTSGWLRSFSGVSYSAAVDCYAKINKLLWEMIPATDVRKGWWVDENLTSPLLEGLSWPTENDGTAYGQEIATFEYEDKVAFNPYTNVKFGCYTLGTITNDEDMPLMRVEEMLLIQAEAQANLGNTARAQEIVTNFVKTYRDPSYNFNARGLSILDEIWFQRRVELWGEGFGVLDALRLDKPICRWTGKASATNWPDKFRFNIDSQDPWLLMRFPQGETNTNFGIVDNLDGTKPSIDQNPNLKDGVTAK